MPALEEKKKKLKEIRRISHAFDIEQIRDHERNYLTTRNHKSHSKPKLKEEWVYRPPKKSERMTKFLED